MKDVIADPRAVVPRGLLEAESKAPRKYSPWRASLKPLAEGAPGKPVSRIQTGRPPAAALAFQRLTKSCSFGSGRVQSTQ